MFGGDNGVIEIQTNSSLPHVYKGTLVLSDLYIGNNRVTPEDKNSPIKDAVNKVSKIRLHDTQRNAAIKVKCINHIYPSDCVVRWTFDNPKSGAAQWRPLNEDNFITFNDLNAGRYQLSIQAMSKESGNTLDERAISVVIRPPF